jgi:hypothetical protein
MKEGTSLVELVMTSQMQAVEAQASLLTNKRMAPD